MSNELLKNCCDMISGFQFKAKQGDDYKIIKLKDVSSDGIINYDELDTFSYEKDISKFLLSEGDIIFKAKSVDNIAALIDRSVEGLVAFSAYIIIRIKEEYKDKILPGYLEIYLNSEKAQDYFKVNAEGSALPIIKIKTLEQLEIDVIPIEKQKELVEIYKLIKDEKTYVKKLIEVREGQFKAYLRKVLD